MKKIAIVTLYGNNNFGNKLQNFALQEYLISKGYKVESIILTNPHTQKSNFRYNLSKLKTLLNRVINGDIKKKKNLPKLVEFSKSHIIYKKFKNFKKFADSQDYDAIIVGSDQVWNPNFIKGQEDFFLLNLKTKSILLSYAASFGVNSLDISTQVIFREKMKHLSKISCREYEGCQLVKKMGYDSELVMDPSFLLKKDSWITLLNLNNKPSEDYILYFFIGAISDENISKINKFSNDRNYKIIDISRDSSLFYEIDPISFVNYIRCAQFVFTDSFHAVVFSIIFNREFFVFSRVAKFSMDSRINNILKNISIDDRINCTSFDAIKINYSKIQEKISALVESSEEFLIDGLKMESRNQNEQQ